MALPNVTLGQVGACCSGQWQTVIRGIHPFLGFAQAAPLGTLYDNSTIDEGWGWQVAPGGTAPPLSLNYLPYTGGDHLPYGSPPYFLPGGVAGDPRGYGRFLKMVITMTTSAQMFSSGSLAPWPHAGDPGGGGLEASDAGTTADRQYTIEVDFDPTKVLDGPVSIKCTCPAYIGIFDGAGTFYSYVVNNDGTTTTIGVIDPAAIYLCSTGRVEEAMRFQLGASVPVTSYGTLKVSFITGPAPTYSISQQFTYDAEADYPGASSAYTHMVIEYSSWYAPQNLDTMSTRGNMFNDVTAVLGPLNAAGGGPYPTLWTIDENGQQLQGKRRVRVFTGYNPPPPDGDGCQTWNWVTQDIMIEQGHHYLVFADQQYDYVNSRKLPIRIWIIVDLYAFITHSYDWDFGVNAFATPYISCMPFGPGPGDAWYIATGDFPPANPVPPWAAMCSERVAGACVMMMQAGGRATPPELWYNGYYIDLVINVYGVYDLPNYPLYWNNPYLMIGKTAYCEPVGSCRTQFIHTLPQVQTDPTTDNGADTVWNQTPIVASPGLVGLVTQDWTAIPLGMFQTFMRHAQSPYFWDGSNYWGAPPCSGYSASCNCPAMEQAL